MGDDGYELLAKHVERVAGKAGGLDVALVHGPGDGGTGNEVCAVFREEYALTDCIDGMAGATNALHAAGD